MEFAVIGLMLVLMIILYIKNPNKMTESIIEATIKNVREEEPFIVAGSYQRLPKRIRDQVDSELYSEIVGFALEVGLDAIEDDLKSDKKK